MGKYTQEELERTIFSVFFQMFDGTYGDVEYYKKTYLIGEDKQRLQTAFRDLLERKYISVEMYDEKTNGVEMESSESMYEYLSNINDYLFKDGPLPLLENYTV